MATKIFSRHEFDQVNLKCILLDILMLKNLKLVLFREIMQTVCTDSATYFFDPSDWDEHHDVPDSVTETRSPKLPFLSTHPICRTQKFFHYYEVASCPLLLRESLEHRNRPLFDDETECWYLQNLYESRSWRFTASTSPSTHVSSPPAPSRSAKLGDGTLEYVPLPCKQCETDRKDRSFILGSAYTHSMAKLLVDYSSSHSGAKILASSDHLQGVSDILVADDNRYLLTQCSNKVWFTVRLADEVFIEKIGLIASELFASTFRHIQILGSRQYPTSEWRVLGEIETNPLETQEWFDLSASSHCSKCYVKYLKIRVLTHHALEGYTNCALTRIQVFGSTLLQSLDKIQNMNSTAGGSGPSVAANRDPSFVKAPIEKLYKMMVVAEPDVPQVVSPINPTPLPSPVTPPPPPQQPPAEEPKTVSDESNNPLLSFVEEMTQLKKQYAAMSHSLYAMNEVLRNQAVTNQTGSAASNSATITVSILGTSFVVSRNWDATKLLVIVLVIVQCMTMYMVVSRSGSRDKNGEHAVVIDFHHEDPSTGDLRDTSRIKNTKPFVTPMKKRHHGIWKPRIRRSVFYHYMGIPNKMDDGKEEKGSIAAATAGSADVLATMDGTN